MIYEGANKLGDVLDGAAQRAPGIAFTSRSLRELGQELLLVDRSR